MVLDQALNKLSMGLIHGLQQHSLLSTHILPQLF